MKKKNYGKGKKAYSGRTAFPINLRPDGWEPDFNVPHESAEEYLRRVHYVSENLCENISYEEEEEDEEFDEEVFEENDFDIDKSSNHKFHEPDTTQTEKQMNIIKKFRNLHDIVKNEKTRRFEKRESEFIERGINMEMNENKEEVLSKGGKAPPPPISSVRKRRRKRKKRKKKSREVELKKDYEYFSVTIPTWEYIFALDEISGERLFMNLVTLVTNPSILNENENDPFVEEEFENEKEDSGNIVAEKTSDSLEAEKYRKLLLWLFWAMSQFNSNFVPFKVASRINDLVDFFHEKKSLSEEEDIILTISKFYFNQKGTPKLPNFFLV